MKINSLLGIFYFLLIAANYAVYSFEKLVEEWLAFAVYSFEELVEERQTSPFVLVCSKFYHSKFENFKIPSRSFVFWGPRKTEVLWGEEKPSDGQGLG